MGTVEDKLNIFQLKAKSHLQTVTFPTLTKALTTPQVILLVLKTRLNFHQEFKFFALRCK